MLVALHPALTLRLAYLLARRRQIRLDRRGNNWRCGIWCWRGGLVGRREAVQALLHGVGAALQEPLNGLAQVLQQVPAVRDLRGLGSALAGGVGIRSPSITADYLDTGMCLQPGLQRFTV